MLVWGKETVNREGLRKQTTAQQNKQKHKEKNTNYFVTLGLQNKVRSLEQEMRRSAAREGEVYSGTRWVEITGKWGDH